MKNSKMFHVNQPKGSSLKSFERVREIINKHNLNTVCQKAGCPNIFECFGAKTSTFMILGDKCTRDCSFCQIEKGSNLTVDQGEPYRVAEAISKLGLKYAVITSVTRDDLDDGGASAFAETISWTRKLNPKCSIEVLTPDFQGDEKALNQVLDASPNVFNHNIETVARLYSDIKPQANYERSLGVLRKAKDNGFIVKSGLMVGLGENNQEILDTMQDLRDAGCDILTIGQYLRPTDGHYDVKRFYRIEDFSLLKQTALAMNFVVVESMPLVRSSYRAHESYQRVMETTLKKAG